MPYKSRAQQGMFHYLESQGKMPKKTVHEFDEATDYKHLPEHVNKAFGGRIEAQEHDEMSPDMAEGEYGDYAEDEEMPHFAEGGMVPEYNFDESEGNASEYDSSGEPHTEHMQEDEQPMEFMSRGGRVKKMAIGGRMKMPSPHFVKALRLAR